MRTHNLLLRLMRAAMILVAVSCVAAVTPLLAQQAQAPVSAPSVTLPGPRLSSQFQRYEPSLARSDAPASASLAVAESHTIVISTLALVLIVVLIVLLI